MSEEKRTWITFDDLIDEMIENDKNSEPVMSVKREAREDYLRRVEGYTMEDYRLSQGPGEGEYVLTGMDIGNIEILARQIRAGRKDVTKQLRVWKSLFRKPKYVAMTERLDEVLYGPFIPGDTRERLADLNVKSVGNHS